MIKNINKENNVNYLFCTNCSVICLCRYVMIIFFLIDYLQKSHLPGADGTIAFPKLWNVVHCGNWRRGTGYWKASLKNCKK